MSNMNLNGQVTKAESRPWDGKSGPITLYSFQIANERRWFRTGTDNHNLTVGDNIEFTFDTANGNVDINTLRPSSGGGHTSPSTDTRPAPGAAAPAASGAPVSRDDYWANKEAKDVAKDKRYQTVDVPRMSFSASQERAVTLVSAALAHDALAFGNTTKGKRLDLLLDYVDMVTDRFFLQAIQAPEHLEEIFLGGANVVGDVATDLTDLEEASFDE